MFGFRYLKVSPTTFVLHFQNGKIKRQGPGLSFFYYSPFSEIALVPLVAVDAPFVFNESTNDFQEVTVQGQLNYRIHDPAKIATVLDYTIASDGRYRTDDPTKVSERVTAAAQILARSYIQKQLLRDVLTDAEGVTLAVRDGLKESPTLIAMGIQVDDFYVSSIKATPEMAKALQADAREALLRKADDAIFVRRNASVNNERSIRENELNTDILVEEKNRQVREAKINADIAIEVQRATLVEQAVENEKKESQGKAFAIQAIFDALKDVDWRVLAATNGGGNPQQNIAIAFRELAENAQKIGELNISPELLNTLIQKK